MLLPQRPFGTLTTERYWIQYVPFVALVVGGLVAVVSAWVVRRARVTGRSAATAVTVLVAAVGVAWPVYHAVRWVPTVPAFAINGGNGLEVLRSHLAAQGFEVDRVWTDWETERILPAYQRSVWGGKKVWTGTPSSLTSGREPAAGDAVLLYSARDRVCDHCQRALEPWLEANPTVPSSWELVYDDPARSVQLYLVR